MATKRTKLVKKPIPKKLGLDFYKGRDGQWYWRWRAQNGKITADGAEGYKSAQGARHGFASFHGELPWFFIPHNT